jgi:hypothetical protein
MLDQISAKIFSFLGFFGSRPLRFWPLAIVSSSGGRKER